MHASISINIVAIMENAFNRAFVLLLKCSANGIKRMVAPALATNPTKPIQAAVTYKHSINRSSLTLSLLKTLNKPVGYPPI